MGTVDRSQKRDVLAFLTDEKTKRIGITSDDARFRFGASRLSAIIWELRNKDGYNIETHMEVGKNRYGHTCSYARYFLKEELKDE